MTFAELLKLLRAEAARDGKAVNLCVSVWHHKEGQESVEWRIWDASRMAHFNGGTPEEALKKFHEIPPGHAPAKLDSDEQLSPADDAAAALTPASKAEAAKDDGVPF